MSAVQGFLLLLLTLAVATSPLAAVVLTQAGRPAAVIGLPPQPDEFERLAAKELADALRKISGASLDIRTVDDLDTFLALAKAQGVVAVVFGRPALPLLRPLLNDKAGVRGAFALQVEAGRVLAAGHVEGTYYAVIELLEQLGCRWFMPGDLGEVMPARKTVEIATQSTVQAPAFATRTFQLPYPEWHLRLRCGGPPFPAAHGMPKPPVRVNQQTGDIEPREFADYFALVGGKRSTRQMCVSNPRLIAYVVEQVKIARRKGLGPMIGLGPNDGSGFCECAQCRALDGGDYDPFSGQLSMTDRYLWFFNQVLAGVNDEYPDTKIAFYIYHAYMRPPKRVTPDPRIAGAIAPIMMDRVHGFSNPIAPEKGYVKTLYRAWGALLPELYDRSYYSNLADPGFTFIIISRLRDEVPACYDMGVKGWRMNPYHRFGTQFPTHYLCGKLMWNPKADVDALLADCYEKFFGPAAKPMGQYIALMDAALCDADYCTGSAWDMPHFYPPPVRARARALLARGRALAAGRGIYAERVKMIAGGFAMTEAFIDMMDARARGDFRAAMRALERCDLEAKTLMACTPVPMLGPQYTEYMNRFFRPCTVQGHARVTGGNRLVAAAKDEWDFLLDPMKVGDEIGLWRAGTTGGNWQRIKTSSRSWSDQGLRYYKGLAWYRQTVEVPRQFAGKRIILWCGGVDEAARVWINGNLIGSSPGAAFVPFELDASAATRPGTNTITMCVANLTMQELGTGGIVAPVILYAPKEGATVATENLRDRAPAVP